MLKSQIFIIYLSNIISVMQHHESFYGIFYQCKVSGLEKRQA